MALRRRKASRGTMWTFRLRSLANHLDAETDAQLASVLGLGVRTLNSWRKGRTAPKGPALKLIELYEDLHGDVEPGEVEERPDGPADSEDLDYWGYLESWRRRLADCGMRYQGRAWPRYGAPSRSRTKRSAGARRRGRKAARNKRPPFPPERVAEREGLNEDEVIILLRVLTDELPGADAHMRRGPFWSREEKLTGRALLDTVCTGSDEYARKVVSLGPDGTLRRANLIEAMGKDAPLLGVDFRLTEAARRELLDGLPELLVARKTRNDLCEVVKPRLSLGEVILADSVRRKIEEALVLARHSGLVFGEWGFGRQMPYGRGTGLLFHGDPGTGKTRTAEALAHELGRDLWILDFSRLVSMWVGQTEKHIVEVFRNAEREGAVLLLDEADAILTSRGMAVRSWEVRDVNVILQEIERYSGVVVLTTNNEPVLDRALERRLAAVVEFPRPGSAERAAIWRLHVPPEAPLDGVIDFGSLASHDLTGGEIKKAVVSAVAAALKRDGEHTRITQGDLEEAAEALVKRPAVVGFGRQTSA